jgi:SAM-dependent methyltransferase
VTEAPSADQIRARVHDRWSAVADGWTRQREDFQRFAMPVSRWMLDAARLQPGHRVLELACGLGDTGLLAAELVQPGGDVLLSDVAEPMLEAARARAAEVGAGNVRFKTIDAEWIDEPAAAFDAVLCRWGYMFPADPESAFRETRRVLRSGGRVALAAWGPLEQNPLFGVIGRELLEQGLIDPPRPDEPGPGRFAPPGRLEQLLDGAGFDDIVVEPFGLEAEYDSTEAFWATHVDLSSGLREAIDLTDERGVEALREGIFRRLEPYREPDGSVRVPAVALVAAASA